MKVQAEKIIQIQKDDLHTDGTVWNNCDFSVIQDVPQIVCVFSFIYKFFNKLFDFLPKFEAFSS